MEFLLGVFASPFIFWFAFLAFVSLASIGVDSAKSDFFFWPLFCAGVALWLISTKVDLTNVPIYAYALVVIGYFAMGCLWSVVRWKFHCVDIRDKYVELLHKSPLFVKYGASFPHAAIDPKDPNADISHGENCSFATELNDAGLARYSLRNKHPLLKSDIINAVLPQASKNKLAITRWVMYWPWSVVVFILGDRLYKLVNYLVDSLGGVMNRVANNTFSDLK